MARLVGIPVRNARPLKRGGPYGLANRWVVLPGVIRAGIVEHPVVLRTDEQALADQGNFGLRLQSDFPRSRGGLRAFEKAADLGLANKDATLVQVHIVPPQSDPLRGAESGPEREVDQVALLAGEFVQDELDFLL